MASKSWHGTLERLGATFSAGGPFIALEAFYNPVYSYKQKNCMVNLPFLCEIYT